jgi:hypothetical protein
MKQQNRTDHLPSLEQRSEIADYQNAIQRLLAAPSESSILE